MAMFQFYTFTLLHFYALMLFHLWNYMVWVRDPPSLENTTKNFGGFCKTFVFTRAKKLMAKSLKALFPFGGVDLPCL